MFWLRKNFFIITSTHSNLEACMDEKSMIPDQLVIWIYTISKECMELLKTYRTLAKSA